MLKPHSKAPRGLVALGSAAIIAVYGAGYARTRTAGSRFTETPALRRPAPPAVVVNVNVHTATVDVSQPSRPARPAMPLAGRPTRATVEAPAEAREPSPVAPRTSAARPAAAPAAQPVMPTAAPAVSATSVPVREAALTDAAAKPAADSAMPATDASSAPSATSAWRDGTYYGWGSSRHGDIQAAIVIVDGRIAGASITQCLTRYSCSWIAHLPAQVLARQSADVDFVTGATQSVDAFYYAVLDALSKAK